MDKMQELPKNFKITMINMIEDQCKEWKMYINNE